MPSLLTWILEGMVLFTACNAALQVVLSFLWTELYEEGQRLLMAAARAHDTPTVHRLIEAQIRVKREMRLAPWIAVMSLGLFLIELCLYTGSQ
jgi:uncharacterized membrane protein